MMFLNAIKMLSSLLEPRHHRGLAEMAFVQGGLCLEC